MSDLLYVKLGAQILSTCFSTFVGIQHWIHSRNHEQEDDIRAVPTPIVSTESLMNQNIPTFVRDSINILEAPPPRLARAPPATRILRAACFSEMMFSFTGLITTSAIIHNPSLSHNIYLVMWAQAPHWSTQITSFCWMGTLGFYIAKRHTIRFDIAIAHAIIWLIAFLYWGLELYATYYKSADLIQIAQIIWNTVATFNFLVVGTSWILFVIRWRRYGVISGSFIIAKLLSYALAFLVFVSPTVIVDLISGFAFSQSIAVRLSSILLALWPTANAILYMTKPTYCLRLLQQQMNMEQVDEINCDFRKEQSEQFYLTPSQHEIKGLEIGEKIGEGIAVVYQGKWRGITVAVKMKSLVLDQTANVLEFQRECNLEMQQEAVMMKTLCHPNIVLFMEVGFYHGSICIISEYCTRGSLRDVLVRAPDMKWSTKVRLALGIAHGLQYLHHASPPMIHRDLKSPNVLVDDSWHAKIADFGTLRFAEIVNTIQQTALLLSRKQNETLLSKRSELTEGGMVMTGLVGTTRWMAPEVMRGDKRYSSQVDIYSFGMILWELIHGQLPFETTRWNHEIEDLVLEGKRLLIEEGSCPRRWQELIQMCWDPKPSKRPAIDYIISSLELIASEEKWDTTAPRFTGMSQYTMITDDESMRSNNTFLSLRSNTPYDVNSTRWRNKVASSFTEATEEGDEGEDLSNNSRSNGREMNTIPERSSLDVKLNRSLVGTVLTIEI